MTEASGGGSGFFLLLFIFTDELHKGSDQVGWEVFEPA
jgi:hypothetical protein